MEEECKNEQENSNYPEDKVCAYCQIRQSGDFPDITVIRAAASVQISARCRQKGAFKLWVAESPKVSRNSMGKWISNTSKYLDGMTILYGSILASVLWSARCRKIKKYWNGQRKAIAIDCCALVTATQGHLDLSQRYLDDVYEE